MIIIEDKFQVTFWPFCSSKYEFEKKDYGYCIMFWKCMIQVGNWRKDK